MTIEFTKMSEIPRDRWDRPLITPVDGGKQIAYTRVSTLAKALDDKTLLTKWMQRQTLIGLTVRPDLIDIALTSVDDKRKLNSIVKDAMSAAKSDQAANIGTALHALSELVDDGVDISTLPAHHQSDLAAYKQTMSGIEILGKEVFVVCDEVQAAGTFDRLVRLPDGRIMVADIKTGQHEPTFPHGATTQIAVYAHGHTYDPDKGRMDYLPDIGVSTTEGLLIHMPAGTGTCDLYLLDIGVGWSLAKTAVAVRAVFKSKPITKFTP